MAAHLFRASRRSLSVPPQLHHPKTQSSRVLDRTGLQQAFPSYQQGSGLIQARFQTTGATLSSPFLSNLSRILRTEIEYQSEYAPPTQPVSEFNCFTIDEHRGEQWIRLTGKSRQNEDIKIEATMFDGCVSVTKPGDDTDGENLRLHMSLLVDICKAGDSSSLEFVCSAWPDSLQIQKVYVLPQNGLPPNANIGPNFRSLDPKLQKAFYDYLEERGVNSELSAFMHNYMMNKDRIELIRWLETVLCFLEK